MSTVRNSAGWDKKFELDVEYVDKVSFLTDLKIIFWTIRIVLKREGINEPGSATNTEFMGTLEEKK
jgi:lipopolysaccharide/colanic/teichoic acid biosynthesis glycosyltransferase